MTIKASENTRDFILVLQLVNIYLLSISLSLLRMKVEEMEIKASPAEFTAIP